MKNGLDQTYYQNMKTIQFLQIRCNIIKLGRHFKQSDHILSILCEMTFSEKSDKNSLHEGHRYRVKTMNEILMHKNIIEK